MNNCFCVLCNSHGNNCIKLFLENAFVPTFVFGIAYICTIHNMELHNYVTLMYELCYIGNFVHMCHCTCELCDVYVCS